MSGESENHTDHHQKRCWDDAGLGFFLEKDNLFSLEHKPKIGLLIYDGRDQGTSKNHNIPINQH